MIRVEKVIPVFNSIVTTANKYPKNYAYANGLLNETLAGKLKDYQTILAVGPAAEHQGFKAGQIVRLNYIEYIIRRHQNGNYDANRNAIEDKIVNVNDVPAFDVYNKDTGEIETQLLLHDRDVICIIEGEEQEDKLCNTKTLDDIYKEQGVVNIINKANASNII